MLTYNSKNSIINGNCNNNIFKFLMKMYFLSSLSGHSYAIAKVVLGGCLGVAMWLLQVLGGYLQGLLYSF